MIFHNTPNPMLFVAGLLLLVGWSPVRAETGETVNPHFTGKHCTECHETAPPALRSGGDVTKLCIRCHDRVHAATFEPHPVNVPVSDAMLPRIPASFPLADNKINCRTCHNIVLQMYENPAARITNPLFLRGDSRERGSRFCFVCHDQSIFQKHNPHRQMGDHGEIDRTTCTACHRDVPDPEKVTGPDTAGLIVTSPELCTTCHQRQQHNHPTRGRHLVMPSSEVVHALATAATDVQLVAGAVHCASCHNPHAAGILARQTGAGEKAFLRQGGGARLCLVCHPGREKSSRAISAAAQSPPASGVLKFHKPWTEQKCKACHAVTAQNRDKPDDTALCLRQGCHEQTFLNKPQVHEPSVLSRCTLCHASHTSEHTALVRIDRNRVCTVCHALLRNKDGTMPLAVEQTKELHPALLGIVQDKNRMSCACHDPNHARSISGGNLDQCADCHAAVKQILQGSARSVLTEHDRFSGRPCSECHDPHAAQYRYQLKQPPETYDTAPENNKLKQDAP